MPTVSVIVPNYNHAPYLRQRIESILDQSHQDFELILLDDCSTDGSRDIMESYRGDPRVSHIVYNEANSGSTFRQWDKGIELAQGECVWVAESDQIPLQPAMSKPKFTNYRLLNGSVWCNQFFMVMPHKSASAEHRTKGGKLDILYS